MITLNLHRFQILVVTDRHLISCKRKKIFGRSRKTVASNYISWYLLAPISGIRIRGGARGTADITSQREEEHVVQHFKLSAHTPPTACRLLYVHTYCSVSFIWGNAEAREVPRLCTVLVHTRYSYHSYFISHFFQTCHE